MAPSESEAETSTPTATDADLARVLTRKDEPEDRSDEIRQLREENARLRKWDELTREIDREERNEQDSKHYAQALVQHARQQRAAREAREAREAEKEFKAAEAASSLCITERGAGPHDAFVRAVIKGANPKIARAPKKNPTVDMAEAEKARKDGNTAIALGNYRRAFWRYADGLKAIRYADDDEEASSLRATLYANRAQAGLHLGFHQAACRDAAASLVEDPSRLKCWHRLGTALFNTGDHALALDACLRGLALKPDHAPLRALELKASAAKAADDAASAAATPPAPEPPAQVVAEPPPPPPKAFEHSARKPVAVKA
jgi:tetratricopeptide (TPR) repeat protein